MDINRTKKAIAFLSSSFASSGSRISKNEKIALNLVVDFYNHVSEQTFADNRLTNKLIIHLFSQLVTLQSSDTIMQWDNGETTVDKGIKNIDAFFLKTLVIDKIDKILTTPEDSLIQQAYDVIYFKRLDNLIQENKLTQKSLVELDKNISLEKFTEMIKDTSNQLTSLNK